MHLGKNINEGQDYVEQVSLRDPLHDERLAKALRESEATARTGSAVIEWVHGGIVTPLTTLVRGKDGHAGWFDGGGFYATGAPCSRSRHIKAGLINRLSPLSSIPSQERCGTHIFGGLLKNEHFGHFLTESLSRLWSFQNVKNIDSVVYYLRDKNLPVRTYVRDMISLICPDTDITIVSDPVAFETLLIPDQLVHPRIGFVYGHPAMRKAVRPLQRLGGKDYPDKVYVSRSRLSPSDGEIVGERYIEETLKANGYTVIHPQELSISEQISFYTGARQLVFADGSAVHLYALVASSSQDVYIVRRRQMGIVFDWQILTFGGPQAHGTICIKYLMIPSKDKGFDLRAKAVMDFELLYQQLRAAGFISRSGWEIPDEMEIEGLLDASEKAIGDRLVRHPVGQRM